MYKWEFDTMREAERIIAEIDNDGPLGRCAVGEARLAAIRECMDILAEMGKFFAGGSKDRDNIESFDTPLDQISCALMVLAMRLARWNGLRIDGKGGLPPFISGDWSRFCWSVTLTHMLDGIPPVDLRVMAPNTIGWRPAVQSALLYLMGQMVYYRSLQDRQCFDENTARNIAHELMFYAVRFGPFPRRVATDGYAQTHGQTAEFWLTRPLKRFVQAANDAKRKAE